MRLWSLLSGLWELLSGLWELLSGFRELLVLTIQCLEALVVFSVGLELANLLPGIAELGASH